MRTEEEIRKEIKEASEQPLKAVDALYKFLELVSGKEKG